LGIGTLWIEKKHDRGFPGRKKKNPGSSKGEGKTLKRVRATRSTFISGFVREKARGKHFLV